MAPAHTSTPASPGDRCAEAASGRDGLTSFTVGCRNPSGPLGALRLGQLLGNVYERSPGYEHAPSGTPGRRDRRMGSRVRYERFARSWRKNPTGQWVDARPICMLLAEPGATSTDTRSARVEETQIRANARPITRGNRTRRAWHKCRLGRMHLSGVFGAIPKQSASGVRGCSPPNWDKRP